MILNNARIHHAKLIQSFLNKVKGKSKLMFLPSYSPESNRESMGMIRIFCY